jgi:acyl-CoA synthetase (AMP-forming)/AMP-acid ligase II
MADKPCRDFDRPVDRPPERICDVISSWVERTPEQVALVESSGIWTYRQLASAISGAKHWLLALGVRPGDRVMIVCENCRAVVAILLAFAALDTWPVLVNSSL